MIWIDRCLHWIWVTSWQIALLVVLATLITRLVPRISGRLRYGIWLVVVARIFVPNLITTDWSLPGLIQRPVVSVIERFDAEQTSSDRLQSNELRSAASNFIDDRDASTSSSDPISSDLQRVLLFVVWLVGSLSFVIAMLWKSRRIRTVVRHSDELDEGPVRVLLEQTAMELELRTVPDLRISSDLRSPFLCGLWQPVIVLPQEVVNQFSPEELKHVFWHELIHFRRRDLWIAFAQSVAQCLFWFHPLVWWASHELVQAREVSCDEIVLAKSQTEQKNYGNTIVRVLTSVEGRSDLRGSLAGIFERGAAIQQRLERIMNFDTSLKRRHWLTWGAIALFAAIALPTAPQTVAGQPAENLIAQQDAKSSPDAAKDLTTAYPVVVATSPKNFAADVDPDLKEISVTFDRPMGKGMSWTGGPPLFPPVDKSRQARWEGNTCYLPVKLDEGRYYRVGINSTGFKNFASENNTPTPPNVLCFVTKGARSAVKKRVNVPKVVAMTPENGATDVDPNLKSIQVTFDMPMGSAFSWTGGGEMFPEIPNGQKPRWSRDGKTCTLPVELKPNHEYRLGLNSLSFNNFQSKWGVPLEPVAYSFKTSE